MATIFTAPDARHRNRRHGLALAILIAATYGASHFGNFFERFSAWSSRFEGAQLDEVLVTAAMASAYLLVLYVRGRARVAGVEVAAARELADILRASPVVLFALRVVDGEPEPHWISDNFAALFGYPPAEVSGREWWLDRVHPEDRAAVLRAGQAAVKGADGGHEFRFRASDGRYRWVLEELRVASAVDGVEVVGSWTDISDRKAVEDALLRSERDYQNLFEHANDAILLLDPEGETVVAANPRACALYGVAREDFVGTSLRAVSRDPEAGDRHLERALASEEPYRFETMQARADGSDLHVEVTASVTEHRGRRVVLSINRDVNERVHAERALRESEARYRMLYEHTPSMLFTMAADGTVLSVNLHGAEHLGYQPAELLGMSHTVLVRPEDHELAATLVADALAAPECTHERQLRKVRRGGDVIWVHEVARAIQQADGRGAVLIACENITGAKEAEAQLRFARQNAERTAGRMRAVAESAAGVVSAGSPAELLDIICEATCRVIDFDAFLFAFYDAEEETLSYLRHYDRGVHGSGKVVPVAGTPAERVIRERRSLLTRSFSDPAGRGGYLTGTMRPSESIIRTPIVAGSRVVGMVSVQSYAPDRYDAADVEVLEAMAAVAAPVLLSLSLRERVQASEVALAESEIRFRSVVDSLSEALLITDEAGIVQYANPRVAQIYGMRPEEVVGGRLPADIALPEGEPPPGEGGPGSPRLYHVRHALPGGRTSWLEVSVAPLHNGSGQVVGHIRAVTDVSERVESEEALRASESQFRAIFDNAAIGMAVVDMSGRVERSNAAFREMLGYTEEELRGAPFSRFRHEEDAAAGLGSFEELLRGDRDFYRVDTRYRRREGDVIWGALTVSVIRSDGGRPVQAVKMVENITERRRAEEAVLAQRAYLRAVIDADPNLIYARDEAGRFTLVNRAAAAIYGTTPAAMVGKTAAELLDGAEGIGTLDRLDGKVFETGNAVLLPEESAAIPLTGSVRWFQVRKVCLTPPGGGVRQVLGIASDITERKRAEAALRESEARLRAIFSNAGLGVLLTSLEGRVIEANPAAEAMLGVTRDRLLQMDYLDFTHPEDVERSAARYRQVLAGDRDTGVQEKRYVRADGESVWVSVTTTLVRNASGDPLYLVDIAQDVTEQKRANRERAEMAERYRMLADGTDDVVSLHDASGVFLYVSPSAAKATGLSPDRLIGTRGIDIVHADDRAAVLASNRAAAEAGAAEVEWRLAAGNPSPLWFASRVSVVRDERGEVHRMICSSRDISARKRAEAAVEFQAGLLDVVGQVVIATDLDGTVLFWNDFAEQLLGWSEEEARGKPVWMVASSSSTPAERDERWARVRAGESWKGELEFGRRDGTRFPGMVIMTPIRDDDGRVTGVVAVGSDLSEQKALERQFQQAQKMEAIGRLAGGVAHDFNNMLTAIRGYAQLMLVEVPEDGSLAEDLQEIDRAASRAADLTRQLLAFSRSQVLEPRLLNLNTAVQGVESMLRRLVGEHITFWTLLPPGLGTVRADPAQVEQILMNLVVNARDAMPAGGELWIETRDVEVGEEEAAALPFAEPGSYVALLVGDTGCGMDRETVERVFEPFFTTKAAGVGTGLGLSTVYGIVKQSGGYLWVDSTPGEGTVFTVWLPRVQGSPEALPETRSRTPYRRGDEAILLVEDEEAVGAVTEKMLVRNDYEVHRARTPTDALALYAAHQDTIKLVITDMVMPEFGGRELADQLHRANPRLPVLFMSGYMESAIMHPGVLDPGTEFLRKPFTADLLTRRVREVLDAGALASAADGSPDAAGVR
jgi:two-component system, cell cycle sensor histidine kinase and response regulator CckA